MSHNRRQILKTAAAVGAGSLVGVGAASAQEESSKDCSKTVQEVEFQEIKSPALLVPRTLPAVSMPVGVGTGAVALPQYTETFSVSADAFEGAELPEKRIVAEMSWNPVEEGPSDAEFYLQRQPLGGGWEEIAAGEKTTTLGSAQNGNPQPLTANSVSLTAVDGTEHKNDADNPQDSSTTNSVIIDGGQSYRFAVFNWEGITDLSIKAKVQAFDPECLGNADGQKAE